MKYGVIEAPHDELPFGCQQRHGGEEAELLCKRLSLIREEFVGCCEGGLGREWHVTAALADVTTEERFLGVQKEIRAWGTSVSLLQMAG